jgi:hypothetical protein
MVTGQHGRPMTPLIRYCWGGRRQDTPGILAEGAFCRLTATRQALRRMFIAQQLNRQRARNRAMPAQRLAVERINDRAGAGKRPFDPGG